ncbi:hypothetical protein ABIF68_006116 [Bradyrhizobium japonicum]
MDRQNFDPSNVPAGSLARHAVSEEPQAGQAGQFEQHVAQASQAAYVASGHRSPAKHACNDVQQSLGERTDASAGSNLLQSEGVLINHERDAAQSRAAKRRRTLPDLEEVVIYRQSSANAASGESSGAPRVASTGVRIRGHSDERPLYAEDAALLRLEHALMEGGMSSRTAHEHGSRLIDYSRWLFENNRPSIVARLDSKSLIDDGAIHKYTGGRSAILVKSIDHFRTFRATGRPVVRAVRRSAERNHSFQNALINPETAVQMKPQRIDDTVGSRGHGYRDTSHLVSREDPPGVLDHLDEQAMPSAVSDPSEELQRLENQLQDERHALGDNHPAPSFSIDPEEFTLDRELFSPEELREWLDDQPVPSPFIQEQTAFHSEHLPQGELERVLGHLDDQAMPSAVSVPSEELQRLEKQLNDELHGLGDKHPALSFSIDPEEFTFNPEQFSPGELRRLLDAESAEELQERPDDHPAPSAFIQEQAAFHSEQLPQGELRRVLDHLDDQAMPSPVSVPSEELQRLEKQLNDELHG